MTRMTGPDCVVMCNLINTYIHVEGMYLRPMKQYIINTMFDDVGRPGSSEVAS